jgi:hypothetical protein
VEALAQEFAGCMFSSSGTSWYFIQSEVQIHAAWRAMAMMCGCALVEPPMAALTTMASRKASR